MPHLPFNYTTYVGLSLSKLFFQICFRNCSGLILFQNVFVWLVTEDKLCADKPNFFFPKCLQFVLKKIICYSILNCHHTSTEKLSVLSTCFACNDSPEWLTLRELSLLKTEILWYWIPPPFTHTCMLFTKPHQMCDKTDSSSSRQLDFRLDKM